MKINYFTNCKFLVKLAMRDKLIEYEYEMWLFCKLLLLYVFIVGTYIISTDT